MEFNNMNDFNSIEKIDGFQYILMNLKQEYNNNIKKNFETK